MLISITKEFNFSAGHFLLGHPKCGDMHGHNYRVLVEVVGPVVTEPLAEIGMIIDFNHLDAICEPIMEKYDHKLLNDVMTMTPTVENLAESIAYSLQTMFGGNARWPHVKLKKVTVYETEKSFATVYMSPGRTE